MVENTDAKFSSALRDLLDDPLICLLMKADQVAASEVEELYHRIYAKMAKTHVVGAINTKGPWRLPTQGER